jgi:hypothetical protein
MTAKEKLRAEIDELTEAEAAAARLVVHREDDDIDQWGSLSEFVDALAGDTLRRLDAEEREAGCKPW